MKKKIVSTLALMAMTIGATAHSANFIAHEWGTFTSVVDKNGKMIQGLHHEEEALPNFVYDLSRVERTGVGTSLATSGIPPRRGGGGPPTRGFTPASMDLMPIPTFTERITQKMETPVIYFYAEDEININVRVDFPEGVISQWFPNVSSVNPSVEAKNGYGVWDLKILKTKSGNLPETSGNSIWNPSREVNSNIVKVNNELEKLVFYRGLGNFKTPISVKEKNGVLLIQNHSNQIVKGLTILNHRDDKNEFLHIDSIEAGVTKNIVLGIQNSELKSFKTYDSYLKEAKKVIIEDLVASGLYHDESVAMVNTWEGGYFQTKGLRLLYVLPNEWTEEILPMKLNRAPKELVRTLVGRIEVLTGDDDEKILDFVKSKIKHDEVSFFDINGREMKGLGHFPEPKLRRALDLDISDDLKLKINKLIESMNTGFLN